MTQKGPNTRDYLAEMCVAGVLADNGWNVYFPHRDVGFDLIATIVVENETLIRPVQVKGKYPTSAKTDKSRYGFVGRLTATHPHMVLAVPYFSSTSGNFPDHIAWVQWSKIKPSSRGFSAEYARFVGGRPEPRPGFLEMFDQDGLDALIRID